MLRVPPTDPGQETPPQRRNPFRIFLRTPVLSLSLLGLCALFLLNCGGGEPPKLQNLSYDQKLEFMGTQVFGTMRKEFVAHNKERYEKTFACETCHSAQGPQNKYKMPGGIFPMDPNNKPTVDDPVYGKTVKFMTETVLPMMKKILNDPSLTCFSCHGTK